jgi:hypothetical protein
MQRLTSQFMLRSVALSACAAAIFFLSGCGSSVTAAPGSFETTLANGSVFGGQQGIVGAHVYLYAVGKTGYGSVSTSMLNANAETTEDTNGHYYVTTDSHGNFSYGGTYTCTAGTEVYLLSLGGVPGGPATLPSNDAIALSAVLGDCSNLNSSTFTNLNEATTVAMAYALVVYAADPTHIGSPATNTTGLANAFATANNLVNTTSGTALATTSGGNGTAPQQAVNTLADILAACVNTTSANSTGCSQLFAYASSTDSGTPSETFSAMRNIADFPGLETANLYGLVAAAAPFQPTLTTQPNDFALGITYTPTGITPVQPSSVVIDAAGDIWMANCQSCLNPTAPDSLLEFGPTGTFLHSYTGSATPGTQVLHNIKGIAIDATGTNIYTVNQGIPGGPTPGIGDDQIIKMSTSAGAVQAGFPIDFDQATYGVDSFNGIAVDNSGEIWATATITQAIVQFTPGGNLINGSPFFIGASLGVAVDNIGNIWFAGSGGNNILEFDTNGDFLENFTPSGLDQPSGMAVDGSNELLTINTANQSLSKIESFNGNNASDSPYTSVGINQATTTAIDGNNQILIPNCRLSCAGSGSTSPDNLLRLSNVGVPNTGGAGANYGAQSPGFSGASGAAIDASGDVWVSNSVNGKLTEVIGFAAPTIQPLAEASSTGRIGQLP